MTRFSSTFLRASACRSASSFYRSSFSRFLDTAILVDSDFYSINGVFSSSQVAPNINSDSCNIFHCVFQDCTSSRAANNAAGVTVKNAKNAKIRIGNNAFVRCVSPTDSSSGGGLMIKAGSADVCLFSNCFYMCAAALSANAFIISSDGFNLQLNITSIDSCTSKKSNIGYTAEIHCQAFSMSQYNISKTVGVNSVAMRVNANQMQFMLQFVTIFNNSCTDFCFEVRSSFDFAPYPIVKLSKWNVIDTSPYQKIIGGMGKFQCLNAIITDIVFIRNEGKTIICSLNGGLVTIYGCTTDHDFHQTKDVQWGEGCIQAIRPNSLDIPGAYDKACYAPKSVKNLVKIDWPSIGTGIGTTALFFIVAALIVYAVRQYKKRADDSIDAEVIGDLTALVK